MKRTIFFNTPRKASLGFWFASILMLSACGGGGGGGSDAGGAATSPPPPVTSPIGGSPIINDPPPTTGTPPVDVPKAANRLEAARFLTQASFGASQASIDELMNAFGGDYAAWIDAQLLKAPSKPEYFQHVQDTNGGMLFSLFWRHATYGDDQLRQRMAFALSQIFVTSAEREFFPEAWRDRASASYYGVLTENAFGNYRDVLEKITLHPYMGLYLGSLRNQKESADGSTIPDQNYAREVMQLFSIGLHQLNQDGTVKRDANNAPLPTYTNEDIAGLSRVFTGWNWDSSTFLGDCGQKDACNNQPMKPFQSFHSIFEKKFLGKTIAGTTGIMQAKDQALGHIAGHPNVAPFIARRLIQQFVTSNPTREYIGRVAQVFNEQGGNLGQVVKAILMDSEARDIDYAKRTDSFGKLREPVIRLANWMRAFDLQNAQGQPLGVTSTVASFDIATKRNELCQYPMSSSSVFNFWRPGFVPNKFFANKQLVAPEMQVVHEVCVANYLQMMQAVIGGSKNTISALNYGLTDGFNKLVISSPYSRELELQPGALVSRMNELLAAGRMSPALQAKITSAVASVQGTSASAKLRRAQIAAFLTMASTDYVVQK
jgi:uncharacterized protein (DUF1800 family)